MDLYVNGNATQQQHKAATIEATLKRYLAAKRQGNVKKVSLSTEEAQKRAQNSVFRLS
ncbi:hypothetical protein [Vreelandella boliviensis]|uniref:hypothetical protein n=1 Tax=Vreelandella boliviensis TaxID=223527 RepID=UPI001B8B6FC4|nr:hypothetical protein [Halomonas boliviensis]MBS3666743.1 hypothetical protein [Halomonas boliviensis]